MKNLLLILYKLYLPLALAAAVVLPILYGFKMEYVMLGVQVLLSAAAFLSFKRDNAFRVKYKSEISLAITVLFVGILFTLLAIFWC